jgi:protein-tyrosine phosphatase
MDPSQINISILRYGTQGYKYDPPAYFHPCILVGAGEFLTPGFLDKHGITHVINCAFDEYSPIWFREKYPDNYICLEAYDTEDTNILDWYPKFKEYMTKYLHDLDSETIYVHCQMGINRSGFLALAFVCKELGYPINIVEYSVIKQRPCILQNTSFRKQIYEFLSIK